MTRVKTGITEFDRMLGGGFVQRNAVMIAGSAGTGKTTLSLQCLLNGITQFNEPGIYVTFEELPDQIYSDAENFGWDLRKLEGENKLRVVCTSPKVLLDSTGGILDEAVKEIGARRIVIDSLSHLQLFVPEKDVRTEAYRIIMYLKTKGLTSFLIWESPQIIGQSLTITDVGLSFLVDSIVFLKFVEIQSSMKKAVGILKMRGSDHDKQLREYEIASHGFNLGLPFLEYEGISSGLTRKVSRSIDDVITKIDEILPERPTTPHGKRKRKS